MEEVKKAENVTLKPKSELLDPNFEGYKLNLEKIPIHSKQVEQGVLQVAEPDNNYSYQEVRLHALHNHLWADPWSAGLSYYFSSDGTLHAVVLDESPGSSARLCGAAVYRVNVFCTTKAHPSLGLVSDRMAVVSDGTGRLFMVKTGDRRQLQPWKLQCIQSSLAGLPLYVVHSVLDVLDPDRRMHVLTQHVEEAKTVYQWKPDTSPDKDATFVNMLSWYTIKKLRDDFEGDEGWDICRLRQAVTAGTIHYACIDPDGPALCAAAERPVALVRDSDSLKRPPKDQKKPSTDQKKPPTDQKKPPTDQKKPPTDQQKPSTAPPGAADVERRMDTSDKQDTDEEKPGLVGAEIEDCDDLPEHGSSLLRIDGETLAVTHEVNLSSHQYLLTTGLSATEQPAFCVRHDVDGLVWQPRTLDGRYQCEHVGTLQAFGFVQASKQQRKFLACAPDMSYAAICETSRHVYIYHQPSPVSGDLRNRKSGQRVTEVSRQQVVSLEDSEPILGVNAHAGAIYVLTASNLHVLVLGKD